MDRAWGARHDAHSSGGGTLDDGTPEAQRAQISEVERRLSVGDRQIVINAGPRLTGESEPAGEVLRSLADDQLLAHWGATMQALKDRGLIRSINRPPIGDYAEHLVAEALPARRPTGPDRGVDLVLANGKRIQVKARLDAETRPASHFDITNLEDENKRFDVFVGVVFDRRFDVRASWQLDWELVKRLAVPAGRKHRLKFAALAEAEAAGEAVHPVEF